MAPVTKYNLYTITQLNLPVDVLSPYIHDVVAKILVEFAQIWNAVG